MALTNKEKMFCKEYIVDFNATVASIKAGYSEKSARQLSYRMLTKDYIQQYIQELLKPRLNKLDITVDGILKDIVEIKERCMQKVPVMVWDKEKQKKVESGEWEFDATAALKATEQLAKYKKMFTDKIEHSSGDFKIQLISPKEKKI